MTKNVLIPIDLDHVERTEAMLKQADEIIKQDDTHVILLNVIPSIPPYVAVQLPENVIQVAADDARASLTQLASKHGLEAKSDIQVQQGSPAQQILKTAADKSVDVIIIGSHEPGMVDYLIGSVAGRVVRHATCSVFVIR